MQQVFPRAAQGRGGPRLPTSGSPAFSRLARRLEVTPGPTRRQFKPRASSTPFLAGRSAGALHPASRSVCRPHCAGRFVWAGAPGAHAGTHAARACTLSTPSQVSGGRGRGGPADAHVAAAGGGQEPQPPVGRKQAATAAPQHRARGPRAPGSPAGAAAVAGWPLPPADGGRRDPGSGRGRGGGRLPAAGSGPRAGRAARAAARPRKGYLLHGSLDGGVWGLRLLQQLQDLLKPLLVRFPLILHLGLLQIKPDTGRDGANVTPRAQARGLPTPSNPFLPPERPLCSPDAFDLPGAPRRESRNVKPGGADPGSSAANVCSCRRGRQAQGADQTESPRICNLAPRSAHGSPLGPNATQFSPTQPNSSSVQIIIDLRVYQKPNPYQNPFETREEI